jgi:hypothetical protein
VHYVLSAADAAQINRRRTTSREIADRMKQGMLTSGPPMRSVWPEGAQAHIGNSVAEHDVFAMMAVRIWPDGCANGQVFLDGTDVFWALSVLEGTGPGTWHWPERS